MSDACSTAPLLGEDAPPAKPSLLGTEALSSRQAHLDDRIRTLSLVICASAVLAAAVYYLQNILVRFVLALALQYLLTPLISAIQCCRAPRGLAILLAFGATAGGLVAVGVLVTRSVVAFSTHADVYHERIGQLLGTAVNATLTIQQAAVGGTPIDLSDKQALLSIASNVDVSDLILHTLRSFAHLTEVLTLTLASAPAPAPARAPAPAPDPSPSPQPQPPAPALALASA